MTIVLLIVLVVIVIVLLSKMSSLSNRLSNLEWKLLKNVEQRLSELEVRDHQEKKAHPPRKSPSSSDPLQPSGGESEHAELSLVPNVPVSEAVHPPAPVSTTHIGPPRLTGSRTHEEWEALIGGKVLNRIGAIAIVLAMAYFMKYAVDQNWLDETVRVFIGGVVGTGLWVWAYFLHRKNFQVFAQGVVGAGIGVLYLSVFASHNFYSLTSLELAFVLMGIVTAMTLLQGLYYDSIAVVLLGWLGGVLTPIILGGDGSHVLGLLSYIFLLNLGLLLIVSKKVDWWLLEVLTLVGTWMLYLSWHMNAYTTDHFWSAVTFVLLYWASFFLLGLVWNPTRVPSQFARRGSQAVNAAATFILLYVLIDPEHHAWMGAVTLVLAGLYAVPILAARRTNRGTERDRNQSAVTTAALVVLATWIELEGLDTVVAWTFEAAILGLIAGRIGLRSLRMAGVGLFALSVGKLLVTDGAVYYAPLGGFEPLLTQRSLALLLLGLGMIASAWEWEVRIGREDSWTIGLLQYGGVSMLYLLVVLDVNDAFRLRSLSANVEAETYFVYSRPVWMAFFWSLLSVPLVAMGKLFAKKEVQFGGLLVASIAGLTIFLYGFSFEPLSMYDPIMNIRALALVTTIAVFSLHASTFLDGGPVADWLPSVRQGVVIAIMLLLFALLTGETRDYFGWRMTALTDMEVEAREHLSNMQQLSISGAWLVYSVALIALGIWRGLLKIRIAAFVLFAITILKIFLYDLSYLDTLYRIYSFIGLGVVLFAVSYAYQRYKDLIFGTTGASETRE